MTTTEKEYLELKIENEKLHIEIAEENDELKTIRDRISEQHRVLLGGFIQQQENGFQLAKKNVELTELVETQKELLRQRDKRLQDAEHAMSSVYHEGSISLVREYFEKYEGRSR